MAKKIEAPEINWDLITPELIKVFTPFIQAFTWLGLSKIDPKVNAMNNLIAIAEVVPAVDLNLPRGIVLAAMYDKTTDALKMMADLLDVLEDIPENLKQLIKDMIKESKEAVTETILDPITENKAVLALTECNANAKKNLVTWPFPYGANIQTYLWIQSCLFQKGFSVSTKWIKDKL